MGTITMPAQQVQVAAQRVIDEILAVRKQRDLSTVQRGVKKRWFSFKKWFYYKTEKEVIEWLDENSFYGWRSYYMLAELEHAMKLLKLSKHGDPVTLNQDDTDILFKD